MIGLYHRYLSFAFNCDHQGQRMSIFHFESQFWDVPSGYLLHSHGIDGPNRNRWFTYEIPSKNGDFPWLVL